jgi:hypothetical protein
MVHRDFLNRFESAKAAATEFNVEPGNIRHWKIRGIPARYWHRALEIAQKKGWEITADELALTKPSTRDVPCAV